MPIFLTAQKIKIMNAGTQIAPATYIKSLTPMRGIAALWVMLFHIDVSLFYRDMGALLPHDQTGILSKGYLWVDFFFLLSGFVISHVYAQQLHANLSGRAIKNYLWARFARLYPLHLFTLMVLVCVTPLVAYFYPGVVDGSWKTYFAWSALPSNLLLTQAMNQHVYLSWNMVSWSIAAEWWTYVVCVPLLVWQAGKRKLVAFIYALFFMGLLTALALHQKTLDITFNYGFWRCLFEFNIGIALYQLFLRSAGRFVMAEDWCSVILLLAIVAIFHFKLNDLLIIPCFSLLILSLAYNKKGMATLLNSRVLQYLGKISYSIYMVHCLWFMVFWFCFPLVKASLGEFSSFEKLFYCLIFIVLTLVSAHFSYHYIELKAQRRLLGFSFAKLF